MIAFGRVLNDLSAAASAKSTFARGAKCYIFAVGFIVDVVPAPLFLHQFSVIFLSVFVPVDP